jgi:hypothetical protein
VHYFPDTVHSNPRHSSYTPTVLLRHTRHYLENTSEDVGQYYFSLNEVDLSEHYLEDTSQQVDSGIAA